MFQTIHNNTDTLLFIEIDVIGVITAISDVGSVKTKIREGESSRRAITIRMPRLAIHCAVICAHIFMSCVAP